jgi:phosphate transport system substrate-binding protein
MLQAFGLAALIVLTVGCTAPAGKPVPVPATSDEPLAGTYTGYGSATAIDTMRVVAAAFGKAHPGVVFQLKVVDTETTIVKVSSGDSEVDFGFIGRELLPTDGVVATTPMGATGSAFAVNAANPMRSLTKAQLRAILSGTMSDWAQLGGSVAPIKLIVREPSSQTRSGLEAYVFGKDKPVYPAGAVVTSMGNTASSEMLDALKSFTGAIGMVTINSMTISNKAIALVAMDGIAPTQANLISGTWPVRRQLYLTTNTDPASVKPAIQALIAFIKSPDGQRALAGQ